MNTYDRTAHVHSAPPMYQQNAYPAPTPAIQVHVHSSPHMNQQNAYVAQTQAIHAPVSHSGQAYPAPGSGAWTTGLCGCCCADCTTYCISCWLPCVLVGRSVEAIDDGETSCVLGGLIFGVIDVFTGCGCLYSAFYRSRLRHKYGLPESPCSDLCTDFCCSRCSIRQVYREVQNRKTHPISSGTAPLPSVPSAPNVQYMAK